MVFVRVPWHQARLIDHLFYFFGESFFYYELLVSILMLFIFQKRHAFFFIHFQYRGKVLLTFKDIVDDFQYPLLKHLFFTFR